MVSNDSPNCELLLALRLVFLPKGFLQPYRGNTDGSIADQCYRPQSAKVTMARMARSTEGPEGILEIAGLDRV